MTPSGVAGMMLDVAEIARGQVVEHKDRMARFEQVVAKVAPDETRSAGDEIAHG